MTTIKAFRSEEGKNKVLSMYDEFMKKLDTPYERVVVNTQFGETSAIVAGKEDAPIMVLLHGSSMNSAMWLGDIPVFTSRYRIIAPDIPGEPGRSDERQLPFHGSNMADWLNEVLVAFRITTRVFITGTSLGGWLAAKFAITYPDKVNKLALICPAGIGRQNDAFGEIAIKHFAKGEKGVADLLKEINGGQEINERLLEYQMSIFLHFNARQETIPIFSDEELLRLKMPAIVFLGKKDIMLLSSETEERIKKILPHIQVVMYENLGHSLTGLASNILDFDTLTSDTQ